MPGTTCTNCGNPRREGAQFCPACGSSAVAAEAPAQGYPPSSAALAISPPQGRTCVDCGNPLREGAQFCPACGSSIVTAAPTQRHTSSSAVPVMTPPTATPRMQPEADSQPRRPGTPDSSGQATSVPAMMPPPPNAQPATKQVSLAPDDSATSDESRLRGRLRPRRNDRRMLAVAGGLLALVAAVGLVLALGGHSSRHATGALQRATKPPAASRAAASVTSPAASATAQPTTAAAATNTGTSTGATLAAETTTQLATLDSILNLAETGRQALANGDITATIANRRTVLQELDALQPDSELSASVQALKAAESYSLHADTTCGLSCSVSVDQGATRLKQAFLAIFNPIAARYNTPSYTAGQI